jgi:hypothetical protein
MWLKTSRAADTQQRCSTNLHEPPRPSPPARLQCPATRGFVVGAVAGIPRWHARGQGFKSPQLHPRSAALSAVDRPRIPTLAQQMRSNRQCAADPVVEGDGHPGHHRRGRLPVDAAHRAAAGAAVAATASVAHQLIDHPRGNAGVLQPGGKGYAAGREGRADPGGRARLRPPPPRPCRPAAGCWSTAAPGRRVGCRCCHRAPGSTKSSGRPPPGSRRPMTSRTWSHIARSLLETGGFRPDYTLHW